MVTRNDPFSVPEYPLSTMFAVVGVFTGLAAGAFFSSLVAGIAFLVVFSTAGALWRRNEPPVLAFAVAYQWLYVMAGFLYERGGGHLAEDRTVGDVDKAILLAMGGFVALTIGIRIALRVDGGTTSLAVPDAGEVSPSYDVRALFRFTVVLYSVNWGFEILPMGIFYNGAQFIYAVLTVREVLFALLWLSILRQREGYGYGFIALFVALVPLFISKQSSFKELVFLLVVVLLTEWRPWSRSALERARGKRIVSTVVATTLAMIYIGALWEGAVKPATRHTETEGTPLEKLEAIADLIKSPLQELDLAAGFQALAMRMDSIPQFSLVLDRVPDKVPHERGALLKRALMHISMPRILFPEKTDLGTDSWLATLYAGIVVGEGTSVGIGYMAEFYVDFGVPGMYVPLLGYGLFLGAIYRFLRARAQSVLFCNAVVIIPFLNHFVGFEGGFAKSLGGIITNVVMLFLFLRFGGAWLYRKTASPALLPLNEKERVSV